MDHSKVNRFALVAAVILFALSRLYLLVWYSPITADWELYWEYAAKAVDLGHVPYRDIKIEYPPAAWWVIALPRWVNKHVLAADPSQALKQEEVLEAAQRYHRGLHLEFLALDVAALVLILGIVLQRRRELLGTVVLCYVICTTLLWPLLYERLDVGLLTLVLLWAWAWIKSLPPCSVQVTNPVQENKSGQRVRSRRKTDAHHAADTRAMAWTALAYFALGLSISYKLVPVIVVPLLLWSEVIARRKPVAWLTLGIAFVWGLAGPFCFHWSSAGSETLSFLKYHQDRPVEIGSLWGSLVIQGAAWGQAVRPFFSHQSINVAAADSPLSSLAGLAPLVLAGACGLWALSLRQRYTREMAYRLSLLLLVAAVIASKVLSPQYFIWALPLALLLGVELLGERRLLVLMAALVLVAGLTTAGFPYLFYSGPFGEVSQAVPNWWGLVPDLHWPARTVLLARNLGYLAAVIVLGWQLLKTSEGADTRGHALARGR